MVTNRNLMIVDDNSGIRKILGIVARREGYTVETYSSFDEAHNRLQETRNNPGHFSAILSDLRMPAGLEGLDLSLKAHELTPNTPVLILSGSSFDLNGKVLPPNIKVILEKPINFDDLVAALQKYSIPAS